MGPVVAPYSQVVPTNGGGLVLGNNVQFTSPQTNSELADLNQVLAAQEYCQYGSPYSDNSQSSYDNNLPQQSPDPQGLANMNIAAAQQQQQRSAGKRSAKGAELESGSNVVPRQ